MDYGVETIKLQTRTAYRYIATDQSPWVRTAAVAACGLWCYIQCGQKVNHCKMIKIRI